MKLKIALGILIIFCYSEIRPALPFLDYFINFEYISEVLCINKEKPMLTCNGKCYLSQQLKETQESKNKDQGIPTTKVERIPMIVCDYTFPKLTATDYIFQKHISFYNFSIKELILSPPTPPPKY